MRVVAAALSAFGVWRYITEHGGSTADAFMPAVLAALLTAGVLTLLFYRGQAR